VTSDWEYTFRQRMADFSALGPAGPSEIPLSIKVGVVSGCFHAEHSPLAYELIDRQLDALRSERQEFAVELHESGPELLVYAALGTAGLTLAKSVIDLVTAIVKARA